MLRVYAERYRKELLESVEPFWSSHSLDQKYGGYFTCLDRLGKVFDDRKYVWLQGRAVWTFSKLYNQVEPRAEWLDAARLGVDFLRHYARDPQGRCYFSLSRSGEPVFFQRKPYGAAFLALGLLEYSKAAEDRQCQTEAIDLFRAIQSWILDPALLGRPTLAGGQAVSRLADVMILAMLALELLEVDNDPRYDDLLRDCLTAAMKHREPSRNVFLETVASDGTLLLDSPDGRFFNPGHSIEVAWFLLHVLRRWPDPILQKQVLDVMEGTLDFGWDREYGGLYYFMDIEGKPMLSLESSMKLWWPHTEAIYAVILAYTTTRNPHWLEWLERLDEYAFRRFADPGHGEWFGYCDRQGNLTNLCKGNNYKGFFHVPRFLLFSAREIDAFESA